MFPSAKVSGFYLGLSAQGAFKAYKKKKEETKYRVRTNNFKGIRQTSLDVFVNHFPAPAKELKQTSLAGFYTQFSPSLRKNADVIGCFCTHFSPSLR